MQGEYIGQMSKAIQCGMMEIKADTAAVWNECCSWQFIQLFIEKYDIFLINRVDHVVRPLPTPAGNLSDKPIQQGKRERKIISGNATRTIWCEFQSEFESIQLWVCVHVRALLFKRPWQEELAFSVDTLGSWHLVSLQIIRPITHTLTHTPCA